MDGVKPEDCPFDTEGWDDLDLFLGNYGINIWEIMSEIINEHELNKEKNHD